MANELSELLDALESFMCNYRVLRQFVADPSLVPLPGTAKRFEDLNKAWEKFVDREEHRHGHPTQISVRDIVSEQECKMLKMLLDRLSEHLGARTCNDFELENTPENRDFLTKVEAAELGKDA